MSNIDKVLGTVPEVLAITPSSLSSVIVNSLKGPVSGCPWLRFCCLVQDDCSTEERLRKVKVEREGARDSFFFVKLNA